MQDRKNAAAFEEWFNSQYGSGEQTAAPDPESQTAADGYPVVKDGCAITAEKLQPEKTTAEKFADWMAGSL